MTAAVISLFNKYLNAGVIVSHKYEDTTEACRKAVHFSPI